MEFFTGNPQSVRGLGNILLDKVLLDYMEYYSYVAFGTDTVNGAVVPIIDLNYVDEAIDDTPLACNIDNLLLGSVKTVELTNDGVLVVNRYESTDLNIQTVRQLKFALDGKVTAVRLSNNDILAVDSLDRTDLVGISCSDLPDLFTGMVSDVLIDDESGELLVKTWTSAEVEAGIIWYDTPTVDSISLSSSVNTCYVGDTVTYSLVALDEDSEPVENARITLTVGGNAYTLVTDASGEASQAVVMSTSGTVSAVAVCDEVSSNTVNVTVNEVVHTYSVAFSESAYTAVGGEATVDCLVLCDSEPLSGATVTFTSTASTTATATTNASGVASATISFSDSTTLTASCNGVSDTCSVIVSSIIYAPTLDGTEQVTLLSEGSFTKAPTISDGVMTNGLGYLTDGWDNTIDWELTFEYYVTGDNNGYLVIPQGTSQRDYNGVQQWQNRQLNFRVQGSSPTGNLSNANINTNTWINVKITKVGYVWTVYYDDVQKTSWNTSSYSSIVDNWTKMCIGLDKNSTARYSSIRNIQVTAL